MRRFPIVFLFLFVFCAGTMAEENAGTDGRSAKEWVNVIADHIALSGYAQGGFEYYDRSSPKDQFKISRIIFMADAGVTERIHAYMMFDFKSSKLHELWTSYRFCKEVNLKVGQFKTPFSIENTISPTLLELIYPSSLAAGYMVGGSSDLMMKGAAGRDIGMTVFGSLWKDRVCYDLALMNGNGRNNADNNSQKDFVARLTVRPAGWLALTGSTILGTGNVVVHQNEEGRYVCDAAGIGGLHANGNYKRNRFAAGAQVKTRPACLRSEMMWGKDGDSHSKGFYATGSLNNVGLEHLDVVASYDWLDIWSGRTERYSAGVQYWFLPKCRIQIGYGHFVYDNAPDQNCILTQIQVRF